MTSEDPNQPSRQLALGVHPDAAKSALFYAVFFSITGLTAPYWPVFLESRGVSPAEIGVLFGVGFALRPVAMPVIGYLADRYFGLRNMLIGLAALWALVLCLFIPAHGFWWLLILTPLSMMLHLAPLADALTLRHQRVAGFSFGRVRLWGSIAFLVINMIGGIILTQLGPNGILGAIICFAVVLVGVASLLRPPDTVQIERTATLKGAARILARPFVLLGLLSAGLVDAAHATYYGFGSLNWRAQGLSPEAIGVLWGTGVVAEVVLLWFAGAWLRRQSGLVFIMIGGIAATIRWSVMALDPPLALVFVLQNLHALTFGATFLGVMTFISRNIEPTYAGSAQGLYTAVGGGVLMSLASMLSGALFQAFGSSAYLAMAFLGGSGAILAVGLILYRRAQQQRTIAET